MFRDEREALRFQVGELEREIVEKGRERDELRSARAAIEAEIEQEAGIVHAGKAARFWALGPVLVVGGVLAGIFLVGSGAGSDAETIFGDVRRVSGQAPVAQGARCTIFVTPVNDEDAPYDTDVEVLCDGRLCYGGETLGGVNCEKVRDHAVRCNDPGFTDQGGDPKMRFDRRAGTVVLADRRPDWRMEIGFAPRPMELE